MNQFAGLVVSALLGIAAVFALTPALLQPSTRHSTLAHSTLVRKLRWGEEELAWIAGSVGIAALLSWKRPFLFPVIVLLALPMGLAIRSHQQKVRSKKRAEVISSELPMVVELLALAISAGESPTSALERVSRSSRGPLGTSLTNAVAELKSGTTLISALESVKFEAQDPRVDRCFDAVILGYERGTSLNDVLHAQALDAREHYRRALIETSARAEIAMMVPVVFLIMPVTILFALFPSLHALTAA